MLLELNPCDSINGASRYASAFFRISVPGNCAARTAGLRFLIALSIAIREFINGGQMWRCPSGVAADGVVSSIAVSHSPIRTK